jgi:mannose-6-phosphate isomerase-like protein (cupin superfamily)
MPTNPTLPSHRHRHRRPPVEMALDELVDIASRLAGIPDLWRTLDRVSAARESVRLIATDVYEAWLLAWPTGSSVEPHDHGRSRGAFAVCRGELEEVRWAGPRRSARRLVAGEASTVRRGVVHDVVGAGAGPAFSIHTYSPPLREMRFYDQDALRIIGVEPVLEGETLLGARAVGPHPVDALAVGMQAMRPARTALRTASQ